jgi:hypothetical protein
MGQGLPENRAVDLRYPIRLLARIVVRGACWSRDSQRSGVRGLAPERD